MHKKGLEQSYGQLHQELNQRIQTTQGDIPVKQKLNIIPRRPQTQAFSYNKYIPETTKVNS